jgi:hypothetical protein
MAAVQPFTKFVPVIVTAWPPSVLPETGRHEVTKGAWNGE